MRLVASTLAVLAVICAGCAEEDFLARRDRQPRAVPFANAPIDTNVRARIDVPLPAPVNGRINMRVTLTNTRSDTLLGGACADRVDAKPLGVETWFDITEADQSCNRVALTLTPGASVVIGAGADVAKMRALVIGPSEGLFVRVRMVLTSQSSGTPVGLQSDAAPVGVP